MSILMLSSWFVGLAGLGLTMFYGRKLARLERARQTVTWDDLHAAAADLKGAILRSGFRPDLILASSARGAIIAHFIVKDERPVPPVLVGVVEWLSDGLYTGDLSAYEAFSTRKVRLHIPKAVFGNSNRSVLILDDFAMSGEGLSESRTVLQRHGFTPSAVRTAAVLVTSTALANGRAPDYYWKVVDSLDFFFPWGKAR